MSRSDLEGAPGVVEALSRSMLGDTAYEAQRARAEAEARRQARASELLSELSVKRERIKNVLWAAVVVHVVLLPVYVVVMLAVL